LTGIEKVGNHGLGTAALEQMPACVPHADGDPYGPTFDQQFSDYRATGSSGCAGHQDFWLNHHNRRGVVFPSSVRYRTESK
jgi:hypothetical protein